MSIIAAVAAILAAVPKGAEAILAVRTMIEKIVDDVARRDFLLECTDLARSIVDHNLEMIPTMVPADLTDDVRTAIVDYGRRMGQLVDEATLKSLGT